MIDYGSFAQVQIQGQQWSGRSGRPLSTLPAEPATVASPLWLIDMISGSTSAEDLGPRTPTVNRGAGLLRR